MRDEQGVKVRVEVKPGARQNRLDFIRSEAPPREGAANEAARALLARLLDLPPSRLRLQAGARSRHKLFFVEGPPALLEARLAALVPSPSPDTREKTRAQTMDEVR
jgi:uncharacterized protein YggU (UPF0235/DUF167 family)